MIRLFILLVLMPFVGWSQVQFENAELAELLERSKRDSKLVFIYGYAEWCEPCEEIEAYTFSDLEVGNFFQKHFISTAIDMEDYPGVELAEQFEVGVYPTFLFLNETGDIVHRGCGSLDASELLLLSEDALNSETNLLALERKFDEGDRSMAFLLEYFDLLDLTCIDAERHANDYLDKLDMEYLMEETGWAIFSLYHWDIYSKKFHHLLDNKSAFEEKVGSGVVNAKIYDTYLAQYQEVYASEELHDFGMRALIASMSQTSFVGSDTLMAMMELHYSEYTENWSSFADKAIAFVEMMGISDPLELSELAWKFYLFIEDRNQLEIASGWAKEAVDNLPEPSMIDTYASLQYKLGNKKRAVELEKKALEMAREFNDNVEHYEHQLSKFEGK